MTVNQMRFEPAEETSPESKETYLFVGRSDGRQVWDGWGRRRGGLDEDNFIVLLGSRLRVNLLRFVYWSFGGWDVDVDVLVDYGGRWRLRRRAVDGSLAEAWAT